ncbi:MAG TPA: FAD-dependent oxidoreductase [Conexibacter sp.]|nr:FAD-dependent oxidoreductase [Conexibacter sp.]
MRRETIRLGGGMRGDEGAGAPPHRSLWLLESLDVPDEPGAPFSGDLSPLLGAARADVAIVGGGYVGLWTALELKKREPALEVTLLEGDVCGGGASGRNGGQIHSWWERLGGLSAVCGTEEAVRLARASEEALETLQRLSDDGLDFDLRRDGWVWTATTPVQLGAWEQVLERVARHGGSPYERLSAEQVAEKTGSPVHLGGIWERSGGTVHPAKLVRGLRRLALEAGVRIHEHTRVRAIEPGPGASGAVTRVVTEAGATLDAARVVLASGAWAAALPEFANRMFVVASDVIATRRAAERLDAIGWDDGAAICDSQMRVLYYQRTPEGRVVFGRGGGAVALNGRIGRGFDRSDRFARDATQAFRRVYPMLSDLAIEQSWSGPVDRTLAHVPLFGRLRANPSVLYGVGWSGSGVAQSVIGGRILASLALDADDEWSRSGLVDQPPLTFPPDPIRWAGAHLVRGAVRRKARAEDAGRTPRWIDRRIAALTPGLPEGEGRT